MFGVLCAERLPQFIFEWDAKLKENPGKVNNEFMGRSSGWVPQ